MSPSEIKSIMEKYDIAPKKLFGQNFLISEGILDKIVKSANLTKEDIVLEVGPGLGALTFKLAPLVKQIIAVEKDRTLVKILQDRLSVCHSEPELTEGEESNKILLRQLADQADHCFKNVEIIEQDILKFNPALVCHPRPVSQYGVNSGGNPDPESNLGPRLTEPFGQARFHGDDNVCEYKLIANIPYYLTSALIRKFLEEKNKPVKIILMIQKEVAQRICVPKNDGRPTSINKMNLLALSVQFYADAKILFYVSKENFWPAPKVDSAVIEITPKEKLPDIDEKLFFKVIRAGFSSKRKQLAPTLARNLQVWGRAGNLSQNLKLPDFCHPELVSGSKLPYFCHPELVSGSKIAKEKIEELLKQINLNPKTRAEELSLEDWIRLIKIIS